MYDDHTADGAALTPREWWLGARRDRYLWALFVVGPVAYMAYEQVLIWGVQNRGLPQDVTDTDGIVIVIHGILYLLLIVVASQCYKLGPVLERYVSDVNVDRYRRVAYALGFWPSLLLPFGPFLFHYCMILFNPSFYQQLH